MKRTPMRRTAFRRSRPEGPTAAREQHPQALAPTVRPIARGTYAGGTKAAAPKSVAYRDRALLDMARNRPCLLLVPGVCNHRTDTTVAAHSNLSVHGKAGARKADDCYSVWACFACHTWLDQEGASADLKEAAFILGLMHQQQAWCLVTNDATEPERFRRAAARALHHVLERTKT